MDRFQEAIEEVQLSVVEILDNIILLTNSTRKTDEEKVKLIREYAKYQRSVISADIAIHNDNIKELAVPGKHF